MYHLQRTEGEKWFSRLNTLVVGLNLACFLAAMIRFGSGGSNSMSNSIFSRSPLALSPLYMKETCHYEGYANVGVFQQVVYDITPENIEYYVSTHIAQIRFLLAIAGVQVVLSLLNRTFFELNIHELRYNFLSFKKDMLTVWELIFLCFGAYLSLYVDELNNIILNYLSSCSEARSLKIYNNVLPLIEIQLSFFGTICITFFNGFVALVNLVGKPNPLRELQKKDAAMRQSLETSSAAVPPQEVGGGAGDMESSRGRRASERRGRMLRPGSARSHRSDVNEEGHVHNNRSIMMMNHGHHDREPVSEHAYREGEGEMLSPLLEWGDSGKGGERPSRPQERGAEKGGISTSKSSSFFVPGTREKGERGGVVVGRRRGGQGQEHPSGTPPLTMPSGPGGGTVGGGLPFPSSVEGVSNSSSNIPQEKRIGGGAAPPSGYSSGLYTTTGAATAVSTTTTIHNNNIAPSTRKGGWPSEGGDSLFPLATVIEAPVSSAMEVEDDADEEKAREDERLLEQLRRKRDKAMTTSQSTRSGNNAGAPGGSSALGRKKAEGKSGKGESGGGGMRGGRNPSAPLPPPSPSVGPGGFSDQEDAGFSREEEEMFYTPQGGVEGGSAGKGRTTSSASPRIASLKREGDASLYAEGASTGGARNGNVGGVGGGDQSARHADGGGGTAGPSFPTSPTSASAGLVQYGIAEHYQMQQRDRLQWLDQASIDTPTEDTERI